jgi:RNA polymerase sigma-70 factor (ECF subfamily)
MDTYRRYAPALLRKAQRMLQSHDDAQDVVQSLFVELLQQAAPNTELAYLYRAVTNRCLNLLRDRSARARLLTHHDVVLRGPVRTTCEDRAIDLDLLAKLTQVLDSEAAEILVYRYVDDMSQEEIAEFMGLSRKTIGVRLARIRTAVSELAADTAGAG